MSFQKYRIHFIIYVFMHIYIYIFTIYVYNTIESFNFSML